LDGSFLDGFFVVSGEERHFVDRKWISWSLGISVLGNFSRMKENCREGNLEEKRETVGSEDIDLFWVERQVFWRRCGGGAMTLWTGVKRVAAQ
jgi:hypothetical protein